MNNSNSGQIIYITMLIHSSSSCQVEIRTRQRRWRLPGNPLLHAWPVFLGVFFGGITAISLISHYSNFGLLKCFQMSS